MNAAVFWFTGLSGAGKSTICEIVQRRLAADGLCIVVLDGDDVRQRLHRHLGFSPEDIAENNALIAGLCEKERNRCDLILVPIISPFRASREAARKRLCEGFHEIHFDAPVETVRGRDVKGLYAKADSGEITGMIGIDPGVLYEPPKNPDLRLDTETETRDRSAGRLYDYIEAALGRNRGTGQTARPR